VSLALQLRRGKKSASESGAGIEIARDADQARTGMLLPLRYESDGSSDSASNR
jgi:hypothetical protein